MDLPWGRAGPFGVSLTPRCPQTRCQTPLLVGRGTSQIAVSGVDGIPATAGSPAVDGFNLPREVVGLCGCWSNLLFEGLGAPGNLTYETRILWIRVYRLVF